MRTLAHIAIAACMGHNIAYTRMGVPYEYRYMYGMSHTLTYVASTCTKFQVNHEIVLLLT